MDRRDVLTAVGTGSVGLFAGCLGSGSNEPESGSADTTIEPTTAGPQNPWGKDTVVVAYEQEVNARHGFSDLVGEALDYWEQNSEMYTGYTIAYQLRPNADDPDILIRLVEEIPSCGEADHDGTIAGCAPLIDGRAPDTAEIEIVDGYDDGPTVETIKHELGHTLGLDHDDEPQEFMSDDIADRVPQYEEKTEVLDRYEEGIVVGNEGTEYWNSGVEYWNDEEYGSAAPKFEDAVEKYEDSKRHFEEAVETVEEIDATEARNICQAAVDYRELDIEAASLMKQAAEATEQENYEQAEKYWNDAEESHNKQSEMVIQDSEVLAETLGLPT